MRKLIFLLLIFCSCTSKQSRTIDPVVTTVMIDTHKCPDPVVIKELVIVKVIDSSKYDSLMGIIRKKNDSLYLERFRLERVKFYNNIVRKNKSQLKFLSGWISRAVQ